jgi:hypothetical protein
MRCAKKDYYADKFTNHHLNPKASWKTINNIPGRGKKQDMIRKIKLPGKTVTLASEFVDVFNEHFSPISDPIWLRLFQMKLTAAFRIISLGKILIFLSSQ